MSQALLKDPVISAGPTRTGTGTGTLSIDKLTHFTTAQNYVATCISKSPDTLFSIVGSLDGPVGIATVGIQFFDEELKIFLTIQQGGTVFEVGDQFALTVVNGSDLHQDNIDLYDQLPQKNFGVGVKGTLAGDHNLRYSSANVPAYLYFQDLKYSAFTAGPSGNNVQVQYLAHVAGVSAARTIQDLTYTAVNADAAGNGISVEYLNYTPAVSAKFDNQNLRYKAKVGGTAGNNISVQYVSDVASGSEFVSVVGNAITVHIQSGTSTANAIKAVVEASAAAIALIDSPMTVIGLGTTAQFTTAQTFLSGGLNAIGAAGSEIVSVTSLAIQVTLQSGVSTATQVKAAVDAYPAAAALVATSISGTGSNTQTTPVAQSFLTGGADGIGAAAPAVVVVSNLVKVYFRSGVHNAAAILSAVLASSPAAALLSAELVGPGNQVQLSPVSATNLAGGLTRFFALNTKELTDAGNFHEGNASLKLQDINVQGGATVAGPTDLKGKLDLRDASSGPYVSNVQAVLNRLIALDKTLISSSAILSHSAVTAGLLAWDAPITLKQVGATGVVTIAAGSIQLADGDVAYVDLDDTIATGTKTIQGAASSTSTLDRPNRYWLFYRSGAVIYTRGGNTLVQNEERTIGEPTSNDRNTFLGATNETDNSPEYTTSGHTAGSVANRFVTDGANLTKGIKQLDSELGTHEDNQSTAHGQTSLNTAGKIVSRDGSGDFAAHNVTLNKLFVASGSGGGLDVSTAGNLNIGASVGANNLTLGGASTTVVIPGNLEVDGTRTFINTTDLEVTDKNFVVNKSGTDGSSEGAGFTVDRASTKGSFIYANASPSRFKAGDLGAEIEIVNLSSAQTLTSKTFSPSSNSITMASASFLVGSGGGVGLAVFMSGDVTLTNAGVVTIQPNAVTNSKLAQMGGQTIKGNNTGSIASPSDLTPAQVVTMTGAMTQLVGDVAATGPGISTATIQPNVVGNTKLAQMATQTFKGRTTAGTGNSEDLTATQATAMLNPVVGDSGAGGTKGLVPAAAAGDAAAGKVLKASGAFGVVDTLAGAVKRYDTGLTNYIEQEYIHAITLTASSSGVSAAALAFAFATFEGVEITYKIKEATTNRVRVGTLRVSTDGTIADMNDTFGETADVGVTWLAVINGANVELRYTTTANTKTMRADVKRFKV